MKKICLVIHSIGIGGMERVMHQLAVNFAAKKKDVEVHLVIIGKKREIVYSLPSSIRVYLPTFKFDESRRVASTLKTMWFLRKEIKRIDPDTILSFGEYWNNLVLLSLFGLAYPVFISDRSEPGKDLGKVQNFLRNKLYPRARGYIAQTREAKKVCLMQGWNDNIKVIGNPIREIQSNGDLGRENIVLTVGRLIRTKHFEQLIRMFVEIGNPDWKLVIVGGDAKNQNLSKELRALVKDLDAEQQVLLEGEQKDIDSYYHRSKLFAFTSSSEGFPNVIGEALSAGLPVVAYDCDAGPADMVTSEENGFLVPLFDQQIFKKKLSMLMENETLREQMSSWTCDTLVDFNVDKIANHFFEFITQSQKDNVKVGPEL